MSKKLNQFFEKDLVLKIISILIGILVWFIVLDQLNPLTERTISVPLRSNREVLESSNISLVSSNLPSTVDVVIRGRKERIEKVSSNDFQAFLDFSSITDTDTTEVSIKLPEYIGDQDIIVLDVYPKVVKIKLENIVRKEFPVSVKWTGELPQGFDAVNVKTNPNSIILEDLESVVNSITSVVVTVDRQNLLEESSINRRVEVYNESGRSVSLPGSSLQVNVTYNLSKTVDIKTTVTGKPKEDYYVKDFTLSQDTVRIIGEYEILKDITELRTEQLDVSNTSASFQKELLVQLPENVQLFKNDSVITAQVNIQQYSHTMLSIPKSSVTIFGGDVTGKMMYRILEDEIAFSVKGPGEILDTLDKKAIRGFVDVSDISEGTTRVEMQVSLPSEVYLDDKVSVTVEAEAVVLSASPTPTPEPGEPIPTPSPEPEEETEDSNP